MKVFVSWSGDASKMAADALRQWLPNVIQAVDVFFSDEDIGKGAKWFAELDKVLKQSQFGILCLTPESVNRPWVLYEAGAIAQAFEEGRVVPLLIGIKQADLKGPLSQFNGAFVDRNEMRKIASAVNRLLGDRQLKSQILDNAFDAHWPGLEKKLAEAEAKARQNDFDFNVFLSTPMAGFDNDKEYQACRAQIKLVFDALTDKCGLKVFWASEKIETIADFDTVDVSAEQDIEALDASRNFVLIYPKRLVTSALFEAGYALAKEIPSHYFVRDRKDLPFLMRELPGPFDDIRIHEADTWSDCGDLAKKVIKHHKQWF